MTSAGMVEQRLAPSTQWERHRVLAEDGVALALTRVVSEDGPGHPVLLTHGTFSNAGICARLAGYLAGHGFDCWILELRGHGASQRAVPAALEAVTPPTGSDSSGRRRSPGPTRPTMGSSSGTSFLPWGVSPSPASTEPTSSSSWPPSSPRATPGGT